jgi:FixJ family two-component response regulator
MNIEVRKSSHSTVRATEMAPVVFVVDPDSSVRMLLKALIGAQGWRALTFESASGFLALPRVAAPSCLLLDHDLPDLNGLDLQQRISDRKDMPVIFITHQTDVQTTVKAMRAGAVEYLIKPLQTTQLAMTISSAIERSRAIQSQEAAVRRLEQSLASLTSREVEVMSLVVSGWLNKEIGATLGISEGTVKVHRFNVMRKMNANSLAELVWSVTRLCLTTPPSKEDGLRASGAWDTARELSSRAKPFDAVAILAMRLAKTRSCHPNS